MAEATEQHESGAQRRGVECKCGWPLPSVALSSAVEIRVPYTIHIQCPVCCAEFGQDSSMASESRGGEPFAGATEKPS